MEVTNPAPVVNQTQRFNAGVMALTVSAFLLGLKFWAFKITNSEAVFSDAMESIVNVFASIIALIVLVVTAKPADRDHPYGHGKFEFFSAAFEGGLITFAALVIVVKAIEALTKGSELNNLDQGLYIIILTGMVNLVLGIYLIVIGKKNLSVALQASGRHLLSDFMTTAGVVIGLFFVHLTKIKWLDPAAAIAVAFHLAYTGIRVVKDSFGALVDREDKKLLTILHKAFTDNWFPGIIRVHYTRIIRSGNYHHVDAHVVLPEFWSVEKAHLETNRYEDSVIRQYPYDGEIHFHLDPCRRAYCRVCDYPDCPVRQEQFVEKKIPTYEEFVAPTESDEFQ